jgi:hypothetical protein
VTGKEIGTPVDVNDVIDSLLQIISAQALQIAKLEALNKKLMVELDGQKGQE